MLKNYVSIYTSDNISTAEYNLPVNIKTKTSFNAATITLVRIKCIMARGLALISSCSLQEAAGRNRELCQPIYIRCYVRCPD